MVPEVAWKTKNRKNKAHVKTKFLPFSVLGTKMTSLNLRATCANVRFFVQFDNIFSYYTIELNEKKKKTKLKDASVL